HDALPLSPLPPPPHLELTPLRPPLSRGGPNPGDPMTNLPEPTDQTALRDRIAEALMRWTERGNSPQYAAMRRPETVRANAYSRADAVLAVLPPTDRAAVLREAADAVFALEYDVMVGEEGDENLGSMREAWDVGTIHASQLLRRMADQAQPEPGARHVHITIRHPDPTTANTAALCIADLIHAEYGDNLHLAITTDAQDTGPAPHRPADETPDTTADTFAGGSYLTAEHDTLGMIAARHGGDRLAWEMANPWVTSSAMVLPAGLRVAIPAQAGPAAGARQDGAPDDVVTELTEAEFHDAAGKALARLGLTYAELEDQARRRDFSSAQARSLWVTIGGAAPAGARQDREAQ